MAIQRMIAQIDAEIAALEARIAKLRDARETIESLEGPVSQGGFHEFPMRNEFTEFPDQVTEQESSNKTPPKRSSAGRNFVANLIDKAPSVKDQILTCIRDSEVPLTSAEIRDRLGDGANKQTVWAALSDMTKNGILNRDDEGRYSIPKKT